MFSHLLPPTFDIQANVNLSQARLLSACLEYTAGSFVEKVDFM